MHNPDAILFDLDGTLIDSSPGILASFQRVLVTHGLEPAAPLDQRLIGPPLLQTLARLTGLEDADRLTGLAAAFKTLYDRQGYRATRPYPGLAETLDALSRADWRLFIATNKRFEPTRRILDSLELNRHFVDVYTLDRQPPPAADKTELVGRLLAEQDLDTRRCWFIGDSGEDAAAAAAHGLPFIAAAYGYGDAAQQSRYPVAARIAALGELPALLQRMRAISQD
ncbi:MAG: HAD family hydrolase [Candidatus Competibacteraceae bacterium]|jgi:phosphoglycolate phosphatase